MCSVNCVVSLADQRPFKLTSCFSSLLLLDAGGFLVLLQYHNTEIWG